MRTQNSGRLTSLSSRLDNFMHRNESIDHINYTEDSMQTQFTLHIKRFGSVLGGLLTACALTLGVTHHAHAVPLAAYLDFDQVTDSGTVSYNGTGGPLVGTNIRFDLLKGVDTPLHNGVTLTCKSCKLSFTTGSDISDIAPNYSWHGGGSLTLKGTAKQGSTTIASGTLLSGTWNDPVIGLLNTSKKSFSLIGDGTNTVALGLETFFGGLPGVESSFANSELTVVTSFTKGPKKGTIGKGFNATVTEADLTSSMPTPTPEPSTILLFGTGLIGMAGYGWRRRPQTALV